MAKSKKITKATEEKLVNGLVLGESPSADRNARQALGYRMPTLSPTLATPEVARAVKAGLIRRLVAESAPAAIRLMENEVKLGLQRQSEKDRKGEPKEPESAGGNALTAAKYLTDLAGIQAAGEAMHADKTPGEMTGNELEEALRKSEEVRSEHRRRNAIEVDSAPSDAPAEGQVTDAKDILFS